MKYKILEGGLHDKFFKCRRKIQIIGGGYGNGKTAAACIRAIELARDYPGSNGLIARSTYPKLNDTIRKEFTKWCPASWIKSFPQSSQGPNANTCKLTNGTTINFRYVAQHGKSADSSTVSNLLSATYDWVIIDQVEDPEITEKDVLDLLGRLRGSTPYRGTDPTMPDTGPRWLILTLNPTRNWAYRKLVKPIHDLAKGIINDDLYCETGDDGKPIVVDGKPVPSIDLVEGSTYENRHNLPDDYIKTLEATYRGEMRARYLLGEWGSFEGLVYKEFSTFHHVVSHQHILDYLDQLKRNGVQVGWVEGFDYGMAVPSCHLIAFTDDKNNVIVCGGHYEAELTPEEHEDKIKDTRKTLGAPLDNWVYADPDMFRRKPGVSTSVGIKTVDLFRSTRFRRGDNIIMSGVTKIIQYMHIVGLHKNPFTGAIGAPRLYVDESLEFFMDEIRDYKWKRDTLGNVEDTPIDRNDHAMDALKYLMTNRPPLARIIEVPKQKLVGLRKWAESDLVTRDRSHRYGTNITGTTAVDH